MVSKALVPLGRGRMFCWKCRREVDSRRPYVGIKQRAGVMRVYHPTCAPNRMLMAAKRNACKMNPKRCLNCGKPTTGGYPWCSTRCQEIIEARGIPGAGEGSAHMRKNPSADPRFKALGGSDWILNGIIEMSTAFPGGRGEYPYYIVLWHSPGRGGAEYGTHKMFVHKDNSVHFAYGHYLRDLKSAMADFEDRIRADGLSMARTAQQNPKRYHRNRANWVCPNCKSEAIVDADLTRTGPVGEVHCTDCGWKGDEDDLVEKRIRVRSRVAQQNPPYSVKYRNQVVLELNKMGLRGEDMIDELIAQHGPKFLTRGKPAEQLAKELAQYTWTEEQGRYGLAQQNPWKFKVGEEVFVRDAPHIPKIWRGRKVKIIGTHTTRTEAGFRNPWYTVKDLETGRVTKAFNSNRLERVFSGKEQNPWHSAGRYIDPRQARRMAKSFSIEGYPTRISKSDSKTKVEYHTPTEMPEMFTPEWHEYMGKVRRGEVTEKFGKEMVTTAPIRVGVGTPRGRMLKERAIFKKMFPFEPYPKDLFNKNPKSAGGRHRRAMSNPYLVSGMRKGKRMKKLFRSPGAARRALGKLGKGGRKQKISTKKYRLWSGYGGRTNKYRRWLPALEAYPHTRAESAWNKASMGERWQANPRRYKQNAKVVGFAKKKSDAEKIAEQYMRMTKKPAGLVFSPRQKVRFGAAYSHLKKRPAMWEVHAFERGERIVGIPKKELVKRPKMPDVYPGEWFWKTNPRMRRKKHARKEKVYVALTKTGVHRSFYSQRRPVRGSAFEKIFGPYKDRQEAYKRLKLGPIRNPAIGRHARRSIPRCPKCKSPNVNMRARSGPEILPKCRKCGFQGRVFMFVSKRNPAIKMSGYSMPKEAYKYLSEQEREVLRRHIIGQAIGRKSSWQRNPKSIKRRKPPTLCGTCGYQRGSHEYIISRHYVRKHKYKPVPWGTKVYPERQYLPHMRNPSKRYRRNIAPVVAAAAISAAPVVIKEGKKLAKKIMKKKNPHKKYHPAYTRMQKGLRAKYLRPGEISLLKQMKKNPKYKTKRQYCPKCKRMVRAAGERVGYTCPKCGMHTLDRYATRRLLDKQWERRSKRRATEKSLRARALIKAEHHDRKKYLKLARRYGVRSVPGEEFLKLAGAEGKHARTIRKLRRAKYIQNQGGGLSDLEFERYARGEGKIITCPNTHCKKRMVRPADGYCNYCGYPVEDAKGNLVKPFTPEEREQNPRKLSAARRNSKQKRMERQIEKFESRVYGTPYSGEEEMELGPYQANLSAARREELQSKLTKLRSGRNVRPPKEWWAGKGKKRGMRKLIGRDPRYSGRSKKAKDRITGGIWHKGYSRGAKIRTIQKIMAGEGGIPNPHSGILETTGESDAQPYGARGSMRVDFSPKEWRKMWEFKRASPHSRAHPTQLVDNFLEDGIRGLPFFPEHQANPLGPTIKRIPRRIAKHVRRVARTRRPIVRGRTYFTPARGGVQVFRGKRASFVEV